MRFFPEHADLRTPERERIRLRHLLTMSDGLAWDEMTPYRDPANTEQQMNRAPDPYRFVLERPVAAPPGERFNYNGGATALLGAILQKAAGRPLDAFAREALWQPLGATEAEWIRYPSGQGDVVAPWGLRLRPRDFAKVGQLFLSGGAWNGTRLVPAAYIRDAVSPHVSGPDGYLLGYHIWLGRSLAGGREVRWAAASGLGGQWAFVAPEVDLVAITTAGLYRSPRGRYVPFEILNRGVLPAVG
jgi:CubicO group peptidase (beta-lactamase class C family)